MRHAPVLGLTARLESGWLDVGAGYNEVPLDVAQRELRHRAPSTALEARKIDHAKPAPLRRGFLWNDALGLLATRPGFRDRPSQATFSW